MVEFVASLIVESLGKVWLALAHNWPFLLLSTLVAVWLRRSVDAERVSAFLRNHRRAGVVAATAAAVATPLCSCGTTAVVLGMVAGLMPWAPIVAFMVASPLTSPQELIYSAGLFGWPFALAFFATSILLGLAGGLIAAFLENLGWLANQARFQGAPTPGEEAGCSSCEAPRAPAPAVCGCGTADGAPAVVSLDLPGPARGACCATGAAGRMPSVLISETLRSLRSLRVTTKLGTLGARPTTEVVGPVPNWTSGTPLAAAVCCQATAGAVGLRLTAPPVFRNVSRAIEQHGLPFLRQAFSTGGTLLLQFFGFAFLGYFVNGLIPAGWIPALFGGGQVYGVPLAATLGLPFYLNTESSLPLVRALLDGGMSQGAALAFMVAGSGTSIGALAGALTIARWRVVGLVVLVLWLGAIACGMGYDALLPLVQSA